MLKQFTRPLVSFIVLHCVMSGPNAKGALSHAGTGTGSSPEERRGHPLASPETALAFPASLPDGEFLRCDGKNKEGKLTCNRSTFHVFYDLQGKVKYIDEIEETVSEIEPTIFDPDGLDLKRETFRYFPMANGKALKTSSFFSPRYLVPSGLKHFYVRNEKGEHEDLYSLKSFNERADLIARRIELKDDVSKREQDLFRHQARLKKLEEESKEEKDVMNKNRRTLLNFLNLRRHIRYVDAKKRHDWEVIEAARISQLIQKDEDSLARARINATLKLPALDQQINEIDAIIPPDSNFALKRWKAPYRAGGGTGSDTGGSPPSGTWR